MVCYPQWGKFLLEAVVWTSPGGLQHYWLDTGRPDHTWQHGQRISAQATGPGALIREQTAQGGVQNKRLPAGWNEDYLIKVLRGLL
jgi:hypothetical protein